MCIPFFGRPCMCAYTCQFMYMYICKYTNIHAKLQVINFNCMMSMWIIFFLYCLLFNDAAALILHSAMQHMQDKTGNRNSWWWQQTLFLRYIPWNSDGKKIRKNIHGQHQMVQVHQCISTDWLQHRQQPVFLAYIPAQGWDRSTAWC